MSTRHRWKGERGPDRIGLCGSVLDVGVDPTGDARQRILARMAYLAHESVYPPDDERLTLVTDDGEA
jgi:hypothetical protein